MKTDKIVLALLFNGISAISLNQQPLQLSQAAQQAGQKMQKTLESMKDDEIVSMMQNQIKEVGNDKTTPTPSDAEAKDAEMKQIEAALSRRILDRLAGGYGPYSAYPWAGSPLLDRVAAVHAYHDMVLGYEGAHNIYGYLIPALDDVHKVLDIVTDTTGMVAGKNGVPVPADPVNHTGKLGAEVAATSSIVAARAAEAAAAAPAAATVAPTEAALLQTNAEGVPVLVSPKLLTNEAGELDLRLRDVIMDGVNGYDLVQLNDNVPEDNTVLQVNGVPVLVNPKLLENESADVDLRLRDIIIDGVNGYDYVQLQEEKDKDVETFNKLSSFFGEYSPAPKGMKAVQKVNTDEFIMTEGVPVLVNPESMFLTNDMAKADLGLRMEMGPDDVAVMQKAADNFNPVFDENVTLMVNGVARTISGQKASNAPIDNTHLQLGNPVNNPPYNNWSVNQPSVPHDSGDAGTQDLGQRNLIIDGVNGYDFVQLNNPVNNPPYNNWSVNQPSVPHDSGDEGTQDLGQRNLIIDGVNGYDFVQTSQY